MAHEEKLNKVREILVGSCMPDLADVAEELKLEDEEEALTLVVEAGVDRCSTCDWWFDHDDMEVNDDNEYVCHECNEEEE